MCKKIMVVMSLVLFLAMVKVSASNDEDMHKAMMWNLEGERLYMSGNYSSAATAFQNAIYYAPKGSIMMGFAYAYNGLAVTYQKLGYYNEALANFNMALTIDNTYTDGFINRGRFWKGLNEYEKAKKDFQEATETNSKNPAGFYFLGTMYESEKNYKKAEELYDTAIKNDVRFFKAYAGKGECLLKNKKYKEAAYNYSRYFVESKAKTTYDKFQDFLYKASDVEDSGIYACYALVYTSKMFDFSPNAEDKYGFAIDKADEAIKLNSQNALAYAVKGLAYLGLNHKEEEAKECFDMVQRLNPNALFLDYGLGIIAYRNNLLDEAIKHFNNSITVHAHDDDVTPVYFYRGLAYLKKDYLSEALSDLNKVVERYPNEVRGFYYRGITYQRLGNNEEALKNFQQAITVDPKYASAYYVLAYYYEGIGNNQGAVTNYKKYLQLADPFTAESGKIQEVKEKIVSLGGSLEE